MSSPNQLMNDIYAEFKQMSIQSEEAAETQNESNEAETEDKKSVDKEDELVLLPDVDFADDFAIRDIRLKASTYANDWDVVLDLGRILRFVDVNHMIFAIKTFNSSISAFGIELITYPAVKNLLKSIHLEYDEKDIYTVFDVLHKNLEHFSVSGIVFQERVIEDKPPRVFNLFCGWRFDPEPPVELGDTKDLLKPFLCFVHQVIANGDTETSNQILCWIASIIQRVGYKTGIALLLVGLFFFGLFFLLF